MSRGTGRGAPILRRLGGLGIASQAPTTGSRAEPRPNIVLVHEHHRTPVVEVKLFKITEKSRKKNLRIFLTGGAYAPYAPSVHSPSALLLLCTINFNIDCGK